eukprot:scaffold15639_cov48-Phaeocystis_antarctica.AAC.1
MCSTAAARGGWRVMLSSALALASLTYLGLTYVRRRVLLSSAGAVALFAGDEEGEATGVGEEGEEGEGTGVGEEGEEGEATGV